MTMLSLLVEIYQLPDLKLNMRFGMTTRVACLFSIPCFVLWTLFCCWESSYRNGYIQISCKMINMILFMDLLCFSSNQKLNNSVRIWECLFLTFHLVVFSLMSQSIMHLLRILQQVHLVQVITLILNVVEKWYKLMNFFMKARGKDVNCCVCMRYFYLWNNWIILCIRRSICHI